MKIKINEHVRREIDIEFPLFTTDGTHYFMFNNVEHCICVTYKPNVFGYSINRYIKNCFPEIWMAYETITKEEFNKQYEKALYAIINKL